MKNSFTARTLAAWRVPTRCRALGSGRVPNSLMRDYYRQRASAGLILTEATSVTRMGVGYPDTPGMWSDEQVEGWKPITQAVPAEGGTIVLQLWHVGRFSSPDYLVGAKPVAGAMLNPWVGDTFYAKGQIGYTDYPALATTTA